MSCCEECCPESPAVRAAAKPNELQKLAYVMMILGTVAAGFMLLPLAWCIPMTVYYKKCIKEGTPVSTTFKIFALIFVNLTAGIIMLCDKSEGGPSTREEIQKATLINLIITTVISGFAILPLAWCIPLTIIYSNAVKEGKPVSRTLKVLTFLFVNWAAGYLMAVDAETDEIRSADLKSMIGITMIYSTVVAASGLIPLAWCIPMTVSYYKHGEENKPLTTGFKVCTLIFVNSIAGIVMLLDDGIREK